MRTSLNRVPLAYHVTPPSFPPPELPLPSVDYSKRNQRQSSPKFPRDNSESDMGVRKATEASLKLDIVIVGGGMGGIASAYALGRSGHRVHVLEQADGPQQTAGGIRVPPNLTKILIEWGLEEEISKWQQCRKSTFHSLDDGELLGYLEWQLDVIKETGGEFHLAHYNDLYQVLYKLAKSVNADITFGATVSAVEVDAKSERPTVQLADGKTLTPDLVIIADGPNSSFRELVTDEPDNSKDSSFSFYTVVVPLEIMEKDPDIGKWAHESAWPMWMGDGRSVLGFPTGNGYCLHVYWPDSAVHQPENAGESWNITTKTSNIDFTGSFKAIERVFTAVPEALRTKYVVRRHAEEWVDETGRVVLLGGAAHPMPCCINGPALAIEDAAVLGELLSRLHSEEQLPQLLEGYQELRQNRCKAVQSTEMVNAAICTMPPGNARDARDEGMRNSLKQREEEWDDSQLLEQWESIGEMFGYSASESCDDWWLKWGILGDMNKGLAVNDPFKLHFEVSESVVG